MARFGASGLPVRQTPEPVKVRIFPPPRRYARTPLPVFDVSETYYRTVIENNLFRPLEWSPPRPIEPYRLLGTKLARDPNTPPQAIVQAVTTNMTHIVTLGSNLDVDTQMVRHPVEADDTLHARTATHTNATDRFLTSLGETPTSGSNEGPHHRCQF